MTGRDEFRRLAGVRLGLVDEQVAHDRHRVAHTPTEQVDHRGAERLALEVEERHLEPRDRIRGDRLPVAGVLLHPVDEPRGAERVLADEELRKLPVDDRLDRRQGRPRRLADPDETLVCVDLDDQPGGGLADAPGPDQGLPEWRAHRRRLHT